MKFTDRQVAIINLTNQGKSTKQIAEMTSSSVGYVNKIRKQYQKLPILKLKGYEEPVFAAEPLWVPASIIIIFIIIFIISLFFILT